MKLIFVGDPMQHGSVPRGALMRVLKDYGGIKPFRLTEILRQKMPKPGYRAAATAAVRRQDAGRLRCPRRHGPGQGDRRRRTATGTWPPITCKSWMRASRCWSCPRRTPKRRHHARDPRAAPQGREARRRGPRIYPAGRGRYQRGRTRAGHHLPAGRRDPVPPERQGRLHQGRAAHRHRSGPGAGVGSGKFSLYRPETIALAVGDRIRFTGTVKTLDGEHTLKNGDDPHRRRIHAGRQHHGSITAG